MGSGSAGLTRISLHTAISVHVQDVALLHVGAILDADVQGSRIPASGDAFDWNDVLGVMRRIYPEREFMARLPDEPRLQLSTDRRLSLDLLERWGGQRRFMSLEECVRDSLENITGG